MEDLFQADQTAEWLKDKGSWAVIASLLLNVVISIFGVVPSVFLSGANAVVFGPIAGFAISLTGEVLGAGVSFWLYRYGIRKISIEKNDTWKWVQRLNKASRRGQIFMLIAARLAPFLPSGIITFASAATRIKFSIFIIGTIIGKTPSVAMETIVGHSIFYLKNYSYRWLLPLALIGFIYLLFRKKRDQR